MYGSFITSKNIHRMTVNDCSVRVPWRRHFLSTVQINQLPRVVFEIESVDTFNFNEQIIEKRNIVQNYCTQEYLKML